MLNSLPQETKIRVLPGEGRDDHAYCGPALLDLESLTLEQMEEIAAKIKERKKALGPGFKKLPGLRKQEETLRKRLDEARDKISCIMAGRPLPPPTPLQLAQADRMRRVVKNTRAKKDIPAKPRRGRPTKAANLGTVGVQRGGL